MMFNKITDALVTRMRDIAGAGCVYTTPGELEKYSHDETEDLRYYPEVVVKPQTTAQVSPRIKISKIGG